MEQPVNEQEEQQPVQEKSYEILELERADAFKKIKSGANWFFWIAALSFINSLILGNSATPVSFIAGLSITQMVDVMVIGFYGEHHVAATCINLFIAGAFVLIGIKAGNANRAAFITGMSLYVADAFIFMYFEAWKEFAFHALAFYFIFKGYKAISELNHIQDKMAIDHLVANTDEGM